MGKYNDIWVRAKAFETAEKERNKKAREEKIKERLNSKMTEDETKELLLSSTDDLENINKVLESEEDDEKSALWETIDFKIIKNYEIPLFNPGTPNLSKNGALKKYKDRFGKYLAFIDCVKFFRSSKYCSILALATTSSAFISIWGSTRNVSNAFKELEQIGLIKEYDSYYQTGICKHYCYFVEIERLLIQYCIDNNIPKMPIRNRQLLTPKRLQEYKERCDEFYPGKFRKKVLFQAKLTLHRPNGVNPDQFEKDLYEILYENYPGFKIYQRISEIINETYYRDQVEFQIRFRPKFHWNENPKNEKSKEKKTIVGIGIRACNKLCSAKKDNDSIDSKTKKILRQEVLDTYGFTFEKDITSSVPRVAYALNYGGWLKEDVDLYEKIYKEIDPYITKEEFNLERDAIKKLFFRVYFDSTDNKLGYHTWDHMIKDGMDKESVYRDMANLRRAMEAVLGTKRYDNFIFYVESCIYIDTLHSLLEKGYKVWLVYDCFYGAGFGSQEDFEKIVNEAVWVSFVRFKMAYDFNDWEAILAIKD